MGSVLPIVAGVVCGLLAAAPYAAALVIAKKRREASIAPAVVAAVVSLAVIALSVLLGWFLFRESLPAFAIALVVVFLGGAIASVAVFGHRPRA